MNWFAWGGNAMPCTKPSWKVPISMVLRLGVYVRRRPDESSLPVSRIIQCQQSSHISCCEGQIKVRTSPYHSLEEDYRNASPAWRIPATFRLRHRGNSLPPPESKTSTTIFDQLWSKSVRIIPESVSLIIELTDPPTAQANVTVLHDSAYSGISAE